MRSVVLSLAVCLSLSACETMPAMNDINFAKLNPFSEKEPVKEVRINDTSKMNETSNASSPRRDALQTELQEIEMLTGSRPVVVRQHSDGYDKMSLGSVAEMNNKAIKKNIDPVFEKPVIDQQETSFNQGDETPQKQAMVPTQKPQGTKTQPTPPASADTISITEAEPAPAAPQGEVKAQPTVDSIKWNTPRQTVQASPPTAPTAPAAVATAPASSPEPMAQAAPRPQQTQQTTPVQSLAMVRNPNLPPEVKGCPSLQIMSEARSITNFNDGSAGGQMTSRASIQDVKGGCEIVDGGMEIDLDIIMKGTVTKAGRYEGNRNIESFITFPYFISITGPSGDPLDKEIMATAFRFKPMVDNLDHAEKITQFIPMVDVTKAHQYGVTVGFQLSRKQLEYNKAETVMRTNNTRVSPDTSPARKRSVNPLTE